MIGATTLAVACAAPLAGPLADRYGRKRAMLVAIGLLVPLTLLLAFCTTLSQVLGVRFLQGMVLPALFAGAVAYVNDRWQGPAASAAIGLYVSGSAFGGFAGRFVAGWTTEQIGWQSAFAALALVSLLCVPVVWRWLPADVGRPTRGLSLHLAAMAGHVRDLRIGAACLFGATLLFAMTGTLSYIGFRLAAPPFGLGAAGIGMVFLVYPIGAAIVPLNGRLLRRFGTRGALAAALAGCLVGQGLLLVPHLAAVAVGLCLFVTGIFLCQSLALGFVGRIALTGKGAAAGLYVCCFYAGGSLGAVVPGLTWASAGWTGCVILVSAVLVCGALIASRMRDIVPEPAVGPIAATGGAGD